MPAATRLMVRALGSSIAEGIGQIEAESYDFRGDAVELGPSMVLVEVACAAINFPDLLMTCGGYQHKPSLPYTPGTEASGTVVRAGVDVEGLRVGDRVICTARSGMMQSYITVPEATCTKLPVGLSMAQGAAFSVAYTTAYHCLVERAGLTTEDTVLINGATGGVGSAAVQVARAVGCATVIATGTTRRKMDAVKQLGASHVVDFERTPVSDLPKLVKGWTGGSGVDVVYDPVGGDVWENSLASTAWGARVAIVGWASNVQPSVRTNYALIKGLSILGCRAGESVRRGFVDPAARMAALHGWIREGKLQPSVSLSVDIHRAQEAFEAVHKREVVGKAVLTLDGSHAGDTLAAKL